MQINGLDLIDEFIKNHPKAKTAFERWVAFTSDAHWRNLVQVRELFNTADYVAPYTVFDIGGNKWRLITLIEYKIELVFVVTVLTHGKYDEGGWRKE